jgi:hypothetical protein
VTKANNAVDHPQHIDDLRQQIRAGWQPKFVFFLSPDAVEATLGGECLSQWIQLFGRA